MKYALLFGSFLTLGACVAEPAGESAPLVHEGRFAIIAQIQLDGGSVTFLDESIGKDVAVGILEAGTIDLGALYEQEATALEIFLAIAPPDMAVPEILYRAHGLERLHNPHIPEQPRALSSSFEEQELFTSSVDFRGFSKDTDNCWGWGNVSIYHSTIGNKPGTFGGHNSTMFTDEFRNWSGIPGGISTSDAVVYDGHAESDDPEYPTAWGHERALAMCVTHAENFSSNLTTVQACSIDNTVNYRVLIIGDDGTSTWGSPVVNLTGYGQGVRYKSSSTNSRRYTLRVYDDSVKSLHCKERYQVNRRSRFNPPYIGS